MSIININMAKTLPMKTPIPSPTLYFAYLDNVLVIKPYWIQTGNGKGEWQKRCITATTEKHLELLIQDYLSSRGILSSTLLSKLVIKSYNLTTRALTGIASSFSSIPCSKVGVKCLICATASKLWRV